MPFHVRLPFAPRTFRFPVRPTRAKVGARPPMAAPRGGIADDTPPDGPHDRPPHAATDAGGPPPGAAPSLGALMDGYLEDYAVRGFRSRSTACGRLTHLATFFGREARAAGKRRRPAARGDVAGRGPAKGNRSLMSRPALQTLWPVDREDPNVVRLHGADAGAVQPAAHRSWITPISFRSKRRIATGPSTPTHSTALASRPRGNSSPAWCSS